MDTFWTFLLFPAINWLPRETSPFAHLGQSSHGHIMWCFIDLLSAPCVYPLFSFFKDFISLFICLFIYLRDSMHTWSLPRLCLPSLLFPEHPIEDPNPHPSHLSLPASHSGAVLVGMGAMADFRAWQLTVSSTSKALTSQFPSQTPR